MNRRKPQTTRSHQRAILKTTRRLAALAVTLGAITIFSSLYSLLVFSQATAAAKEVTAPENTRVNTAQAQKVYASQTNNSRTNLQTAVTSPTDFCVSYLGGDPMWLIGGWLIGMESYHAYQDPEQVCPGAYPFTIQEAHLLLMVNFPTELTIPITIEIRDADTTTTPGCPIPDTVIFKGSAGSVTFQVNGFYDIVIPLDVPVIVEGPFFVGLSFDDTISFDWGLQLVTDDIEALCVTYNNWDSTIGFVDLGDDALVRQHAYPAEHCCAQPIPTDSCHLAQDPRNPDAKCFDFDGRLSLWTEGLSGGELPNPAPGIEIITPNRGELLYAEVDIWASETAGSRIIDSAVFSYNNTGAWLILGVDSNDSSPSARQAAGVGPGDGLSYVWDFSSQPEGVCSLKVVIYDTLGRTAEKSISVLLEPTPPVPSLSAPEYYSLFCDTLTLTYDLVDDDIQVAAFLKKLGNPSYNLSLDTMNQFALGDADGNPFDGNPASEGEFGDYYAGPVVAALCMRYWHGQGYTQTVRSLTNAEVAEGVAAMMLVQENAGLRDDRFALGLIRYLALNGLGQLSPSFSRQPNYSTLRNWTEEIGMATMLGVTGIPGEWLAVDGFLFRPTAEGANLIVVSDPWDGSKRNVYWRDVPGGAEIFYDNAWREVRIIVGLLPTGWTVPGRQQLGFDFAPIGQTSISLDSAGSGLVDGSLYFITAQLTDAQDYVGQQTQLLELNCNSFAVGDYNGNGVANIGDLSYLIAYQLQGGAPPVGGADRADVNCDTSIDLADIMSYINWIFQNGPAPCK